MVKTRVTHILYSGLGGHGNVFRNFVLADGSGKLDSNVIFYGIEPVRREYLDFCAEHDLSYQYVKKRRGLDLLFYQKVAKIIVGLKPDTVFLHGSYLIFSLLFAKMFCTFRMVIRETQANHLKSKLEKVALFVALRKAEHVVFLTNEFKDQVMSVFSKSKNTETHVIPNGVDLSKLKRNLSIRSEVKVVCMIARLVSIKDTLTLIEAFASKEIKERGLILKIAGDGEEKQSLESICLNKGLNNVEFLGVLNESQLVNLLHESDIYAHATFGETLSTSLIMAMAAGLPIVSNSVEGVANMIKENENGFLIETKNPCLLSQKILELANSKEKRIEFANNNQIKALALYSSEAMVSSYIPLIEKK